MSSDNDQIPKSVKRKKLVIPDSEDSDESIVQSRRKKKTHRVISEGESSDEDSDIQRPTVRRQNQRVITEDDTSCGSSSSSSNNYNKLGEVSDTTEWQSDWSSSSESEKKSTVKRKVLGKPRSKKPPKILSDVDSDTSDDQTEKCPICLLPFRRQQLGTPSSCEHCFCLECLVEWNKNVNTCPVDRQTFTAIHVRNEHGGQVHFLQLVSHTISIGNFGIDLKMLNKLTKNCSIFLNLNINLLCIRLTHGFYKTTT